MEILYSLLPERVGSPLSLNALSEVMKLSSDMRPAASLCKFQSVLQVPAIQLVHQCKEEGFRLIRNGEQRILVAPAWLWLSRLSAG